MLTDHTSISHMLSSNKPRCLLVTLGDYYLCEINNFVDVDIINLREEASEKVKHSINSD